MTPEESTPRSLDLSRALVAGVIATVVMTVVMALFGNNIMKMLGSMMLSGASSAAQYMVGGIAHLMVGLFYAVLFAWLFGRVRAWHPAVKGIVFGLAITAIALATMPVAAAMMGGDGGAGNPCGAAAPANPCGPSGAAAGNPCNPSTEHGAGNPCAPGEKDSAMNPCNPYAADDPASAAANPCAENPCAENPCAEAKPGQAKNACSPNASGAGNPCSPCGGPDQGPWNGMISLINHLVFGLGVALIYGRAGGA
jgi:hypothetical protein